MNWLRGFSHLPDRSFNRTLGIGSAYGCAFAPVASRARKNPQNGTVAAREWQTLTHL